ncbi:MAG: c-type cytochrome [Gammaproteobacteria bacterium]|nr:c-type cytochrome [Gammaproteobacteria bacterium]
MPTHEQNFFDGFMLLLGVLIGALAGIVLFADWFGSAQVGVSDGALIDDRIRPIGQVVLFGDPDIGVESIVAAAAEPDRAPFSGSQVYDESCYLCHAAPGIGGAPVLGDMDAWTPRIAQGTALLHDHVLNGYQGDTGFMPPKGGRLDLTDEEVFKAIDFFLEAVE